MKKIPLSPDQAPMQSPFAALDAGAFPPAPPEPQPPPLKENDPPPASCGRVALRRERSGRGGKTVVIAGPFPETLSDAELGTLCKAARKALGCGGHVTGREIELQGDHPARTAEFLRKQGFAVYGVTESPQGR